MTPRSRWFSWLMAVVVCALVVRAGVRDRGVITDHLEFGRRLLAGAEMYEPYLEDKPLHPPYPPSFGLMMAPFSLLHERSARWAWACLQAGALLYVLAWLRRALADRVAPHRTDVVLALTLGIGARFVLRDTHGGGGNLINLALVLAAFAASRDRRPLRAGCWLGLSLATKPVSILFVPLLAVLGRRRAAVWSVAVAGTLALLSLALLRFDTGSWQRWLQGTVAYGTQGDVFATPALGFPPFTWMNQCLRCAVARFVGEVPAAYAAQVPHFLPGLGGDLATVVAVRSVLSGLLLVVTAAAVWRRRREPDAELPLVAATFALSLLLSPISWKAHHVALLPSFGLLFAAARPGIRWPWIVAGSYAATCVLGEELTGKAVKQLLQSSYLVTAGTLALWGIDLWRGAIGARRR
ncbi:MAG: glycosyltransferase family 87 protein [Planctomycetota bacterium]